jgi:hypothetical protein
LDLFRWPVIVVGCLRPEPGHLAFQRLALLSGKSTCLTTRHSFDIMTRKIPFSLLQGASKQTIKTLSKKGFQGNTEADKLNNLLRHAAATQGCVEWDKIR